MEDIDGITVEHANGQRHKLRRKRSSGLCLEPGTVSRIISSGCRHEEAVPLERERRLGPRCFQELVAMVPGIYSKMCQETPALAAIFKARMQEGVAITSTFSGMCTPAIAGSLATDNALRDLTGIVSHSACDPDQTAQMLLLRKKNPPEHVFIDLLDRLHEDARAKLETISAGVLSMALDEDKRQASPIDTAARVLSRRERKKIWA